MTGAERLTTSRVAFLDRHIGVTKADNLGLVAGLDVDGRLLRAAWSTERLIDGYFSSLIVCHIS